MEEGGKKKKQAWDVRMRMRDRPGERREARRVAGEKAREEEARGEGDGEPVALPTTPGDDILLLTGWGGEQTEVPELSPHEAWRYLGVWVTLTGDYTDQLRELTARITAQAEQWAATRCWAGGAKMIHDTVLKAQVMYPLKFTTAGAEEARKLQRIAKKVLKRHLHLAGSHPNANLHGAATWGGVGVTDWGDELTA